jgi:hypothetical protein
LIVEVEDGARIKLYIERAFFSVKVVVVHENTPPVPFYQKKKRRRRRRKRRETKEIP